MFEPDYIVSTEDHSSYGTGNSKTGNEMAKSTKDWGRGSTTNIEEEPMDPKGKEGKEDNKECNSFGGEPCHQTSITTCGFVHNGRWNDEVTIKNYAPAYPMVFQLDPLNLPITGKAHLKGSETLHSKLNDKECGNEIDIWLLGNKGNLVARLYEIQMVPGGKKD